MTMGTPRTDIETRGGVTGAARASRAISIHTVAALNEFDAAPLAGFTDGLAFSALRTNRHRGPNTTRGVYVVNPRR